MAYYFLEWIVVVAFVAQLLWIVLRHFKQFRKYQKLWELEQVRFMEAAAKFDDAQQRGDKSSMEHWHEVCHQIYRIQLRYVEAEQAVMSDNFIPPWRWPERWNADYLKETETAL